MSALKHEYRPLNEPLQNGCDISLFEREALWWNRAVKSLVILALLSVTTWAVLRANENGALSDLFVPGGGGGDAVDVDVTAAPPKAPVSLTDNDLQHQWNTYEEGEWSTSTTTTATTPARDGGLYAVATNEYSHLNNKLFPYPFLDDGILVEPFKEVRPYLLPFFALCLPSPLTTRPGGRRRSPYTGCTATRSTGPSSRKATPASRFMARLRTRRAWIFPSRWQC